MGRTSSPRTAAAALTMRRVDGYNDRMIVTLLAEYEAGPDHIEGALAGVPASLLDIRPGPDAWSIHEIIVHLSDAEIVGSDRIRRALADEGARLPAFDESAWGDRLHYATRDLPTALETFRALRRANADLLRRVSDEDWNRTGLHSDRGPMTLIEIVQGYVGHVEYHVHQMEAIKAGGTTEAS
jgi:hypothetical protein